MVAKKVTISLNEELLSDMDKLIQTGAYDGRSDLIYHALMQIEPLKTIHEKRTGERIKDLIEVVSKVKPFLSSDESSAHKVA